MSSGWQGDNRGGTAHDNPGRDFVIVPIAKNPDGSAITGTVMGRIINAEGNASSPIIVHSNPLPYEPVTLDTSEATSRDHRVGDYRRRHRRDAHGCRQRLGLGSMLERHRPSLSGHA